MSGAPISPDVMKSILPQVLPQLANEIQRMLEASIPGVKVAVKGDKVVVFIPWDAIVDSIRRRFAEEGIDPQVELYEDGVEIHVPVDALVFMTSLRTSTKLRRRVEP